MSAFTLKERLLKIVNWILSPLNLKLVFIEQYVSYNGKQYKLPLHISELMYAPYGDNNIGVFGEMDPDYELFHLATFPDEETAILFITAIHNGYYK
jgi:hypothetical protein